MAPDQWEFLNDEITACQACPRLVAHCREIAATKRKAFLQDTYWGRSVPNFGDPQARLLIIGLEEWAVVKISQISAKRIIPSQKVCTKAHIRVTLFLRGLA